MLHCFTKNTHSAVTIYPVTPDYLPTWLANQSSTIRAWVAANGFTAKDEGVCLLPSEAGSLHAVLFAVNDVQDFWAYGVLPEQLPSGDYCLDSKSPVFTAPHHYELALLAWGLGSYRFTTYLKQSANNVPQLVLPESVNAERITQWLASIYLIRDLVNTPTEDLCPADLAEAVVTLGNKFSAQTAVIKGDQLLEENYPAIHAVGRASDREPHLIDLRWGNPAHPKVTLVGKGVCFDSGGLDLKSPKGMLLMKKDMGGAAHALGLARMIMASKLPVSLRLLIPAVENVVSGNSYRPGDVLYTRNGLTVEVTNTDAEGRLVLCDALTEAVSEAPEVLFDFATLTGAARVALGPDVPVFFTAHNELAQQLLQASTAIQDPIWQLPLFKPYQRYLKSCIADCYNAALVPHAGAITAALFLQQFVPQTVSWVHFDLMAWNEEARPGRPVGGEAMAIRTVFAYLANKYQ